LVPSSPLLEPKDVATVLSAVKPDDEVFWVGGQAINFWALRSLPTIPELLRLAPFASKHIGFLLALKAPLL
jgi:hypothetical protein